MTTKWKTGPEFRTTIGRYETQVIPVSHVNTARSVCAVYAGFGDGPTVAALIAAAPEVTQALRDLTDWVSNLATDAQLDKAPKNKGATGRERYRAAIVALAKADIKQ